MKEIAQDPASQAYRDVSGYLARIEHFCVGVNKDIYDRETVYALAHGYLDKALKYRLAPILEKKKTRTGQEYYDNYMEVLSWMREREKQMKDEEEK